MRFLQGQAQSPLQEINLNDYVSLGESDPKLIDELSDKNQALIFVLHQIQPFFPSQNLTLTL